MRNRYLDLLRAAAIVRVIVYHLFGWPWLSIVLPAMGIMFALAGSLTAASLEKRAAGKVITSRLRRLLPPLWLLGLIAVPAMVALGWQHEHDGDHPFSIPRLLFWILPLGDPPGSQKGVDVWEPLWYIRAYVWFILFSPVLYALYRRIGWFAVILPLVVIGVLDKTGFSLPDTADAAMWDFVTYGACWIAGFAHHDGRLARLRPGTVIVAALLLGGAGLYWLQGHQGPDAWDLNDVSEAQALWSLAVVLPALRWQPRMAWLSRIRPLDKAVTLLNARAVTVYLWHNIAIAAVWPLLTLATLDDVGHHLDGALDLAAALLVTAVAVLLFGWVEDLAARRRPRLWPTGGPVPRPAAAERISVLVGADPAGGRGPAGELPAGGDPGGPATDADTPVVFPSRWAAGADEPPAMWQLPDPRRPPDRPGDAPAAIAGTVEWPAIESSGTPDDRWPSAHGSAPVAPWYAEGASDPFDDGYTSADDRYLGHGSASADDRYLGHGGGHRNGDDRRGRAAVFGGRGRHSAGEPDQGGLPDLGLPVAGRRVAPMTDQARRTGPGRQPGAAPAEGRGDGPPAWPRPRQDSASDAEPEVL